MNFKPVRRTQLISPFGVGAMVDFPRDEALMTAGLDAWPFANEDCPSEWKVVEERLQKRLGIDHFRLPPDFRTEDLDPDYIRQQIPYVRFPRWHFCPVTSCGLMVKRPILGGGTARCLHSKHQNVPEYRHPRVVPVRFVAICPRGHIEDFPFMNWVHKRKKIEAQDHELYYMAGRSAALSGITIRCSCGAKENLGGAFNYDNVSGGALHNIGYDCKGDQPWLDISGDTGNFCGGFLRAVQRGGSNVYFPHTFSSIYLPLWGEKTNSKIVKTLEDPKVWKTLTTGLDEGKYISRERSEAVADLRGVDAEELRVVAQNKLDGNKENQESSDEEYRFSEYEAFKAERGGEGTDLLVESVEIDNYNDWLSLFFKKICLVRKLRETRALAGFSRLLPAGADGEDVGEMQPLAKNNSINWLPVLIVRGEGIFLEFDLDAINAWIKNSTVSERIKHLTDLYNQARVARTLIPVNIDPKFILLHSFAHLLIRQLSYDCGYGSASLRERIYCNEVGSSSEMQGILIYTAAGDSEGTMGGLVRKGEPGNFEPSIYRAIAGAAWCSSDPVCIESPGQGSDNANLAACHGCTLLPETSCEEGNRMLDRATLMGMPDNPGLGFFRNIFNVI